MNNAFGVKIYLDPKMYIGPIGEVWVLDYISIKAIGMILWFHYSISWNFDSIVKLSNVSRLVVATFG